MCKTPGYMRGFQPLLYGRLLELLGALLSYQFVLNHHAVLLFLADHTCRMLYLAHLNFTGK
jgi:hypothetical protein